MFYDPGRSPRRPGRVVHRFFFALKPPPQLARQWSNAADWFDRAGAPVGADRLHLTVFILPDLADVPSGLPDRLGAAGAAVSAPPVDVTLDYVSGGNRSVALRPRHRHAGLAALHAAIARICRDHAIPERPDYAFNPHVTLGYRDGAPFGQRIAPTGWTATDFVLIHSHVGLTRHDVIGRWPLVPREPDQGRLF